MLKKTANMKNKNNASNTFTLNTDEFLLLKNKDSVIITKIFTALKDYIYKFIYYRTGGNVDEADEIFCDSAETFLKYLPKIKYNKNIKNLWIKITSGKISEFYKHKKKQINTIDKIKDDLTIKYQENNDFFDLEKTYFIYQAALETIKENYKAIIVLRYKENRTLDEICRILSCRNKRH